MLTRLVECTAVIRLYNIVQLLYCFIIRIIKITHYPPSAFPLQLVDLHTTDAETGTWSYALHGSSIRWYPLFVALVIIPMGMIQLIKYLVPFSIIANGLISAGTVVLFYFIFTDDGGRDPLRPDERSKLVVWPINRWSLFAGSALCSMEGVGMVSIVFTYVYIYFFLSCKTTFK